MDQEAKDSNHLATWPHTYIYTYIHTYIHTCKSNAIILLPLSGHAHLAEPGYLCTKQALGACASKLLENGLGTHRRMSYLLTASGPPGSPPACVRYPSELVGVVIEPMTNGSRGQIFNHLATWPHTYIHTYIHANQMQIILLPLKLVG